jgi:hypothetical protein
MKPTSVSPVQGIDSQMSHTKPVDPAACHV